MNKKRLQRLGVVCMAAAMVLTTVSFPRVAKAEGDTSTQANEATSNELEKRKSSGAGEAFGIAGKCNK